MMPRSLYLIVEGDSLTTDGGVSWPTMVTKMFTDNRMVSLIDAATGGNKISDLVSQAASQITPCYDANKASNILTVWAGTNSLSLGESGDFSGANAYSLYSTYCAARKATGFKVVAFTLTPRQDDGLVAGFDAERLAFNALVRANYAAFADALVDPTLDSRLTDPTNATYFNADKLHLTVAGDTVVSGLVYPQIARLLN